MLTSPINKSITSWMRFVAFTLALLLLAAGLPVTPADVAPFTSPSFGKIAQNQPTNKIDPQLLQSLGEVGAADFFVWMVEQADLSPAAELKTKAEKGQFVYNALRATAERTQKSLRAQLDGQGIRYRAFYIANKIMVYGGTRTAALDIAARPDVARITPNRQYQLPKPFINPKATLHITAIEPNLTFIRADQVWNMGIDGAGTVLAGNDTGLQWDHPAIKSHYRGWDGATADHNYNWWDATGTYPNAPADGGAHGTHTTGTMVGDDGGANQIGVAPGAQTIHCKNMTDGGSGDDFTFTTCFEWDLAPWDLTGNNPRPDLAPDAVNNSWGYWGGNVPVFEDEVDALQAAGIVVEVSAGNEGPGCTTLRSPGDHDQVITTGSVDHAFGVLPGGLTGFSSRGPSLLDPGAFIPDVMAPGENIRSSVPGGGYEGGWSGTSMAGPHVTALVGLMWSANPAMAGMVEQTYDLIRQTAIPLTNQLGSQCGGDYDAGPNNDWGHGTIDALEAVNAAIAFGDVGTLQGMVTSAADNSSIDQALVKIVGDGWTFSVYTDGAGFYTRQVPAGVYDVTASKYGFFSTTATAVEVVEDVATVQDFTLEPAPLHSVSGRVTDSQTGWPLYAAIAIDGYPGAPIWTNPETGEYAIDLVGGSAYTLNVTAWMTGYLPAQSAIGVLEGPLIEDFALTADPFTCIAPGYEQSITEIDFQDFEADDGGYTVSGATSWEHGAPTSGPGAAHSGANVWATNLSGDYGNSEDGSITSPTIDLSAYAGETLSVHWWEWLISETNWDYAYVEASDDGGATWHILYIATGTVSFGWGERAVNLDVGFADSDFKVRFRFTSDPSVTYAGWYVDDVALQTVQCSPPASGGLVVGHVYDGNSMIGIDGAHVENEDGFATTTVTVADPVGRGFYTLFSPAGSKLFTASRQLYSPETVTVEVQAGNTVRQDFALKTGYPVVSPDSLSATTPMGQLSVAQLDLQNQGEGSFNFEINEAAPRFTPVGDPLGQRRNDAPTFTTPAEKSSQATSEGLALPAAPALQTLGAGDVIQSWPPTANPNPWGVAYLADDTVWVGEGWGEGHADEYLPNGAATGDSQPYAWYPELGPADFAFNANSEMLWIMDVGSTNCIHEFDPASGATGQTICPAWGTSQRGLAYDPWMDTYFAGGWNEGMIYRFTPDGAILDAVSVGLGIAGLAFNPDTQHLFVMVNDDPNPVVVLDVAADYAPVGQFMIPGFSPYSGAGLEMDCGGKLWAVEQQSNTVYQVESGETTSWCSRDIPWLDADPDSGAVDPHGNQTIDVTFDASVAMVDQPGHYTARLNIKTDTPYGQLRVPVTMTVTPPPTWGKIMGMVSTPGYCDENPAPLHKAQVVIQGSQGFSRTLLTNAGGAFSYWLDESESPLTLTVSKEDYEQGQVSGIMLSGQMTTTQDVAVRMLLPCVSIAPPTIEAVVELHQTAVEQAVIENAGAGAAGFNLAEKDGGFTPLAFPTVQLPAFEPDVTAGVTYAGDRAQSHPARTFTPSANAFYSASSVNILLLAAADVNSIRMILDSFPDMDQVDVYDARLGTPTLADLQPYDAVVVISNNPFANPAAVGNLLADYVDEGGNVVQTVATFHDSFGDGWGLQGRFVDEGYSPFIGIGDWFTWGSLGAFDASHPIMQGVTFATDYFRQVMELTPDAQWVASWSDDEFVATKGRVVALNTHLADGYAWTGDIPLIVHNSIIWLQSTGDVLWLSQDPADGMIAPESQQPVDIIFDAHMPTLTQPGAYHATLVVQSGDRERPRIGVPVTMTVNPPPTWGKLAGNVSSQGYCDSSPGALSDATVIIQGSLGGFWEVSTDSGGNFAWWLDSAENPLTLVVSAPEHEDQEIGDVMLVAQETTTQDFSLNWLYPCISMDLLSFEETLRAGDVIVRTLTLYNDGAGMGIFEIGELNHGSTIFGAQALAHIAGQVHVVAEDKSAHPENTTSGAGQPGPSATGGPDAFGYIYRDSFEPDGPPYRWVEIAPPAGGDGVELAALTGVDDGYFYPLALPFPFSFYGTDYSQLAVASNGALYFDDAYLGFGNTFIPSLTYYNVQRFIAPLWDDLVIDPGAVYYQDLGAMFIIEFYQVSAYGSPESATWQAVFFPNGSILFQYQDVVFGDYRDFGGSATVGIQSDVEKGLQYSFDAPWLSNHLAICFAPPGVAPDCSTDVPWLDEIPQTGFVPPYSSAAVDVVFDATVPEVQEPATYHATLSVRTNDVFASPLRAPVAMIVEPTVGPMLSVTPTVGVVNHPTTVEIRFTGAEFEIAATTFSLDFDQDCLNFDPTDGDQDDIPDAIQFNMPAAFAVSASYDGGDLGGEIDFAIADNLPPLSSLPDGVLATVKFTPSCEPQPGETITAPVGFSAEPKASFGNTSAQSIPGTVEHGWIDIRSGTPGDCNGDGAVDAADIIACVLEIFDGDGSFWLDTPGGTYPGNPVGCDSNADRKVDAGDIVCTVLTIFEGPGVCGMGVTAADATPARLILSDAPAASPGSTVETTLSLASGGRGIAAAVLALDVDRNWLRIDPTDADRDGVIDAVKLNTPAGMTAAAQVNPATGVLEIYAADLSAPLTALSDGVLATLTLQVTGQRPQTGLAALFFAQGLEPSLGDVNGQSAPVETVIGQPGAAPEASDLPIRTYLPTIQR